MEAHPIAEKFPLLEGEAWEAFKADVAANGVRVPVVLYNGQILDGRNRYRAAVELGLAYPTIVYEDDDPYGHVRSLNVNRRHLTTKERAEIAAQMATVEHGSNRYTKKVDRSNEPSTLNNSEAARVMRVSPSSVKRAKSAKVRDEENARRRETRKAAKEKKSVDETYAEHRREVASLPETAKTKFERLVASELDLVRESWKAEVRAAAEAMVPELQESKKRFDEDHRNYIVMRKGLRGVLSEEDFRFLINALHPDREPNREKLNKAFVIVQQLAEYVRVANAK